MLLAASIVLLALDAGTPWPGTLRSALSTITGMVYYVAETPYRLASGVSDALSSRGRLLADNERLRERVEQLSAEASRMDSLQVENEHLRSLLGSRERLHQNVLIAEIVGILPHPSRREITIDKGLADKVRIGQAIIDSDGLVGQVIEVGEYTSRVLLITDASHAVPVQINRNNMRLIAAGTGDQDRLVLENVPMTSDVRSGDLLVSSGLGGRFPAGYPVGTVTGVSREPTNTFAVVTVKPNAGLDQSRHVLLVFEGPFEAPFEDPQP